MKLGQRLVLGVGLVLGAVTLLVVSIPELAGWIPITDIVDELGGDYVFVAIFGGLAVLFLIVAIAWRGVSGLEQAVPPTPEEVQSAPLFGADFDEITQGPVSLRERLFSDRPDRVRERVRNAAIRAEMAADGCSRSQAERRVASGTWTTDPEAAAFLSDDAGPSPPLSARLLAAAHGQAWYQRGARRAAAAVVERTEATTAR